MTRRRPETFLRMSWWPLRQSPGVGDCQDAATSHHQDPTQPHPLLTQLIAKDTREKCVLNRILLLPLYHISLIPEDNLGQLSLFLWIQQCVCILFLFILLPSCSSGQSPDTHCRIQKTHSLEHRKYLFSQVTSSLASLSLYMKLSFEDRKENINIKHKWDREWMKSRLRSRQIDFCDADNIYWDTAY